MRCKWIDATLLEDTKEYGVEWWEKKIFGVSAIWPTKAFNITSQEKKFDINYIDYKKQNICYCIRYRPIWLSERILARWWWNDKGIRTEDWIFNDWIV